MRLDELKIRYERRGLSGEAYATAARVVTALDAFARSRGEDVDGASEATLAAFIATLVETHDNSEEGFYGLLRYYYVVGRTDLYIVLTRHTGGIGVVESILARLERRAGKAVRDRVAAGLALPPLGTPPSAMPAFTTELMKRLRAELPEAELAKVLSGNNHGIPDAAFAAEKTALAAAATFSDYLADYHERQVAELARHAADGTPWYEQQITPEVVAFVAADPEIQGGVFKDGFVIETKIPYDIVGWLHAETPLARRKAACHCPFARESIAANVPPVDPGWCHCSGGFVKRRYEVLFGRELAVRCLSDVLSGADRCRFAVDLRDVPGLR